MRMESFTSNQTGPIPSLSNSVEIIEESENFADVEGERSREEGGANGAQCTATNIDRIVAKSTAFESFDLENLTTNTKSAVWSYTKRLFTKKNGKSVAVRRMVGRIVCVPCFKNGIIKR